MASIAFVKRESDIRIVDRIVWTKFKGNANRGQREQQATCCRLHPDSGRPHVVSVYLAIEQVVSATLRTC